MSQAEAETARPQRRARWRDNVEALVMAVTMALFLKHFVVEAYKIPTGSMQPTLIGDEEAGIKDRILVDKLSYALRAPRRWEVAVFRYPLDRSKNFVKRIVGVGPEELRIQHGDVWNRRNEQHSDEHHSGEPNSDETAWRILRRPATVMSEHWKRLDELEPEESRWIPQELPQSSRWKGTGRALSLRGSGTASFRGGRESILDGYLDGYPEALLPWLPSHHRESAQNAVGDLRLEGEIVCLPGTRSFAVVLREGAREYRFELPGPAAHELAEARIDAGPSARIQPEGVPFRLPAGRAVRFAVENLDDRLALEIDGSLLCALEIEPADNQFSSVRIALDGEGAELTGLMPYRDVYYTSESSDALMVPAGSYFMLGDNTQDSSDSREWAFTVFELAGVEGELERVRGNWRDRENPRPVGFGEPGGPFTYLVDEWGEPHWFPRDAAHRRVPQSAPFVPRSMIQGKALAVFWPLDPTRGIYRLKWVN